jgi:tetratricopeptide (TPR) repeat protein
MRHTRNTTTTRSRSHSSRRTRVGLILVAVLAPIALYCATIPVRTRQALEHASLTQLQTRTQADPNDLQAQYSLARRARREGQYQVALSAYSRVAMSDPSDEAVWTEFAQTAAADHQIRLAVQILQTFVQKNPDGARAHAALAEVYVQGNAPGSALDEASEAVKLDSGSAEAWLAKGQAAEAMVAYDQSTGDYGGSLSVADQARDAYRKAISLAPSDWRGYAGLGSLEGSLTHYGEAISPLRRAVSLGARDPTLYAKLGSSLVITGSSPADVAEAIRYLLQATALEGGLSPEGRLRTYLALGQAYQSQARWRDALPWLQKAAVLAPGRPDVHFALARVYQGLGDTAQATKETQVHEALAARTLARQRLMDHVGAVPSDSQARLQLARLLAASGEYAQAAEQYRTLLRQVPQATAPRKELEALLRAHSAPSPGSQ